MSKKSADLSVEEMEQIAAQLVAASEGLMSVPSAMKTAGFSTPQRKNATLTKRACRKSKGLKVVYVKKPTQTKTSSGTTTCTPAGNPSDEVAVDPAENASVSSLSNPPSNDSSGAHQTLTATSAKSVKRNLEADGSAEKKRQRTSKQKNEADAAQRRREKLESNAIKQATNRLAHIQTLSPSHVLKNGPNRGWLTMLMNYSKQTSAAKPCQK